jgi:hypothetical protein
MLRRWRSPAPEQPVDPDQQAAGLERPLSEHPKEEEAPPAKPSLLARLKNTLRRQPAPETLDVDADEPMPDARRNRNPSRTGEANDAASEETSVQPGRFRRTLAALTKKWVWIPAASVMLLAMMGAMLMQLQQSAQEKEKLQAELRATQQKLEQASGAKKPASRKVAANPDAPGQTDGLALSSVGSGADSQPGFDEGGCVVTDKESVSQNLKNCIDDFNRSMASTRPASTTP